MNAHWSRRQWMKAGAILSASGFTGRSAAGYASAKPGSATPWRNWSGHQRCLPAGRVSPESEAALSEFLAGSSGKIRPVGAGHSFSSLVPTEGHLLVIDQLSGLLDHDPGTLQATLAAGTRLSDIGPELAAVGQGMLNLPDIDRQTLAGATATATHGTGLQFTCLSGFVSGLRLVKPNGDVVDVDAERDPDLFNAARVSLGALGIVTRMTLQNREPYFLKAKNWVQPFEEVLESFDEAAANHRHFEMFPLTHSDYALVLSIDEIDSLPGPRPQPQDNDQGDGFGEALAAVAALPPSERKPVLDELAPLIPETEEVGRSHEILSNIRNTRFNEMEYSVPLENGAPCLREILYTIIEKAVDVTFPLEYRYVKRDDTWLSMSSGDEDHAAISIHRVAGEDFRPYFDLIEPIFWKYGGRPHWGKIHSLDAAKLSALYPHFKDFQALRAEIDPDDRMLNEHLRHVLVD